VTELGSTESKFWTYYQESRTRGHSSGASTDLDLARLKVETVQQQETTMPLVQVHAIKGVFTSEMKKKVIEKVTDAMVAVEGENLRGVTCVTINEVDSGDWGIGGRALTAEYVKALAAGKAAA
jgi:4-oxalocrotonate tautomerase